MNGSNVALCGLKSYARPIKLQLPGSVGGFSMVNIWMVSSGLPSYVSALVPSGISILAVPALKVRFCVK